MTTPVRYDQKHDFIVEIDGIASAGFKTCSEIRMNIETVSHREGARLHTYKAPGLVEFPPITLERGVSDNLDLYSWARDTFDAAAGTGLVVPDLYRTIDVVQYNRAREEVKRARLFNAWCKEFSAGDWDNDANEVVIETVVVEYEYFEIVPA